jgi:ATP synthase protein I
MNDKKQDGGGSLRGLGTLASMGITLAASTFIGLLFGIYLDRFFDTKPVLMLVFLVFGIIAGFKNMYEVAKKYGDSGDEDRGG